MKKLNYKNNSILIDLPLLEQEESSCNVEYKGRNVFVGRHSKNPDCLVVLVSDDLNNPEYTGFQELYPSGNESLSELFNRNRLWGIEYK